MRYFYALICLIFVVVPGEAQDSLINLNLQAHYDFRRDHPTVTQEFFVTDKLGYTFFFMDVNFDHTRKKGGASDFYFELMRYFTLKHHHKYTLYATVQYDDGSDPIARVWLAGLNVGNIKLGQLEISTEFLLKKEYHLDLNWQYTLVWFAAFFNGKIEFNGFFDYWVNDVDNQNWPAYDPEIAKTRYSFQAEPQLGWRFTPHWKVGSELEISRGFLGSVTGRLAIKENYQHDTWYFLPTVFLQYNF
jgi:hypothetical protein